MIAFFDLDGTLLPLPGIERRFIARLVSDGQLSPWRLSRCALSIGWQKLGGDRWAQQHNKDYLAGMAMADVEEAARALALDVAELLRPDIMDHLRAHARRGHAVVLLTGAIEALAHPIAERIGGTCTACATLCASQAGRFLARPPLRHPFGAGKASLARDIAERHGLDLHDCWAYGDSRHDLALLGAVGHPVAVYPDRVLRREARLRGWPIIDGGDRAAYGPPLPAQRA
jgi:HAD superfamily hydrolase (TIGR01490 family)